jgi:hypothetical protein
MRRPPLPYLLLAVMTLIMFGGPFAIVMVMSGGASDGWPPDRPVEWITLLVLVGLAVVLFFTSISIRLWYPVTPPADKGQETRSP